MSANEGSVSTAINNENWLNSKWRRTQVTRARAIRPFDNRSALEESLLEQGTPVSPRHV